MNFFFWNYHIFDIKIIEVNICSIFKKINLQQNTLYRTLSTRVIRIKKRKRKWLEISNISKIKKEVVRAACNTWKRQNEPCVQWDLSATFSLIYIFFFLFLWSGFSDLYLFFNNVHFFLFFSFSVLIFFFFFCHSHLETENRGSRAPCQLSSVVEKRRETEGRTDDETRYTPSWLKFYLHSIFVSIENFHLQCTGKIVNILFCNLNIPNHFENLYISKNFIFRWTYAIRYLDFSKIRIIYEIQVVKIRNFWEYDLI